MAEKAGKSVSLRIGPSASSAGVSKPGAIPGATSKPGGLISWKHYNGFLSRRSRPRKLKSHSSQRIQFGEPASFEVDKQNLSFARPLAINIPKYLYLVISNTGMF